MSADDVLSVDSCEPPMLDLVYYLEGGANLISYPEPGSTDISEALPDDVEYLFEAILSNGVAAMNTANGWLGSITSFSGGHGYWVIVENDLSFSYNINTIAGRTVAKQYIEILPEELIFEEVAEEGYSVSSSRDIIAGVYTEISDKLKQEGMVRDLIRQIQNLRKDSGLRVEDRIEIGILGPPDLQNAVRSHESYFMNEVLGVKLQLEETEPLAYNQSVTINGNHITIGISPIN